MQNQCTKYITSLFFLFFLSSRLGAQDILEKNKVLHIVIDSVLGKRIYPTTVINPLNIVDRSTFPVPKEHFEQYIIPSGDLHFQWEDTLRLYQALNDAARLTADEFLNSDHIYYSDSKEESDKTARNMSNLRNIFNVHLSTPVFSDDGKLCWLEVYFSDGYQFYLLKKDKSWKIDRKVGGTIQCGSLLTPEEYYKLTGKKIEDSSRH